MIGCFWIRFRPAITMAICGFCFLCAASGATYGQEPVAADAAALPPEEVLTLEEVAVPEIAEAPAR